MRGVEGAGDVDDEGGCGAVEAEGAVGLKEVRCAGDELVFVVGEVLVGKHVRGDCRVAVCTTWNGSGVGESRSEVELSHDGEGDLAVGRVLGGAGVQIQVADCGDGLGCLPEAGEVAIHKTFGEGRLSAGWTTDHEGS